MVPFSEILEECSTITVHTIDKTLANGRSNLMAITLCFQNASQVRLAYGKNFADVILNSCGNFICGQATGETARLASERFGKTMQERESMTISSTDTNITQSGQLEQFIPASRISSLSSGEFVGMVADSHCRLPLRTAAISFRNEKSTIPPHRIDISLILMARNTYKTIKYNLLYIWHRCWNPFVFNKLCNRV